jgi:PAS domain S-box-containing protein
MSSTPITRRSNAFETASGRLLSLPDSNVAADPRQILADRVAQLYNQLPVSTWGSLLIGAIVTVELWSSQYSEIVVFWCSLLGLLAVGSLSLLYGYRRSADPVGEAGKWMRWIAISALATGSAWGFASAVFFPSHTDEQQVFLALVLAGVASGGMTVYAASWIAYALFLAGIYLAFMYVLGIYGSRMFAEIAVLIPLFYATNLLVAYRLQQVFTSGYRLRRAYGTLTQEHTQLNERLMLQLGELEEARRQVEASGRKLSLFAERSPIAVFEFDPQGRVLSMNPAAENLFGYSAREVQGQAGTTLIFSPRMHESVTQLWRDLIRSREPMRNLRYTNQRSDGVELVCEWSLTPLVNPENRVISVIVQGQDVTRELEAERLKKEFTSTLSHELRTPLTSIIGSLQLINTGVFGEVDKDILELTQIAERNGQRLLDLINDLLDVEKIESGKLTLYPEVFLLDDMVIESLELNRAFGERFKVQFQHDGAHPLVRVEADRKRLQQVMTNLLSNAAKFSPEGGVVEISMQANGTVVRVCIHDRGPGIPENFRVRIFSRFSQADSTTAREKGGTGLGLAICKRLVELMGGQVGFDDRPGGGTTFWFELPLHAN